MHKWGSFSNVSITEIEAAEDPYLPRFNDAASANNQSKQEN